MTRSALPTLTRRPPTGRLGRTVPIAATIIRLWLLWRWLRLKRAIWGHEAMAEATHQFHRGAALAVVRRAIRQQGLIIKTCQFLGSRADILMDEYVRTLSLVHDQVPPRPWTEMRPIIERELDILDWQFESAGQWGPDVFTQDVVRGPTSGAGPAPGPGASWERDGSFMIGV